METIFTDNQRIKADFILNNANAKLSSLQNFEIKELAIVWSYYSGKIEGNTYSYVETELLLKDGVTSIKSYDDAKMLKNLYNTFIQVIEQIKKGNKIEVDKRMVCTFHSMLADELVQRKEQGTFRARAVHIRGTTYVPPTNMFEIEEQFTKIISQQDNYNHPLERAIFLHCNIARLQPFIDGNKRTSRLIESSVLMNNDIIPVYSVDKNDINSYRKGIISFYEELSYELYADYFLNRQIQRINEVATDTEIKFDLETNKEIPPSIPKNKRMNI